MYQIKSDRVPGIALKTFGTKKNFFYIRIYLDGDSAELDAIELVKYTLHPTFVDPVRVSDSRSDSFEIKIWTYGYFDISALLIMKDGTTRTVGGYVRWPVEANEVLTDDAAA